MFENDPEFRKLKDDFQKAKKAYEIAAQHRMMVREMHNRKRQEKPPIRRPVGSAANYVIPQEQNIMKPKSDQKAKEYRIYMGEILGWAKLDPSNFPMPQNDTTSDFDVNNTFDQISLKLYWNTKVNYLRCKEALEKYVPKEKFVRQEIDILRNKAKASLKDEANLQLLGLDNDKSNMVDARIKVEEACKVALAFYQSSPDPKSKGAIVVLLENLSDSQFVGLESETTDKMIKEFDSLQIDGRLTKE